MDVRWDAPPCGICPNSRPGFFCCRSEWGVRMREIARHNEATRRQEIDFMRLYGRGQ